MQSRIGVSGNLDARLSAVQEFIVVMVMWVEKGPSSMRAAVDRKACFAGLALPYKPLTHCDVVSGAAHHQDIAR